MRSYFLMRDLKDDMQSMLNLDDGYESSNASETIRNCKNEQRGYDITSHSGMDMLALLNTGTMRDSCTTFSCSSSERPVVQTTMGILCASQ